ncbi:MAG: peptide chain release factor N(5)-glutamine methyltransferase [Actinomycetes bacterium]
MARDLLRQTRDYFKAQGIPEIDASILLEHLLNCTRSEVQLKVLRMSDDEVNELDRDLRRLVLRRQNGEPVQYITGTAPFRYLEYQVGPGVLIPRPETESLVALVLAEIQEQPPTQKLSVIDLGSGSGCVAISLATERVELSVTAVENSEDALPWLHKNVETLAPQVRIVADSVVIACQGELFDLVVSNPPYVPNAQDLPVEVRKEPAVALFGGDAQGITIPALFIAAATRLLKSGGFFAMEHDQTQGDAIAALLSADYQDIKLVNDLTGRPRFTIAKKR